jgi:hypothetical protein
MSTEFREMKPCIQWNLISPSKEIASFIFTYSTLKIESSFSSETSVLVHQSTVLFVPEDSNLHGRRLLVMQIRTNQIQEEHKYLNELCVCILAVVLLLVAVRDLRARAVRAEFVTETMALGPVCLLYFGFPLCIFSLPMLPIRLLPTPFSIENDSVAK